MTIPGDGWAVSDPELGWSELTAEAKHERILRAAGTVFAREGLAAPMPLVASEAGVGIGSVYRQFPSKHDLLAALVVRRLEQTAVAARDAAARAGEHWEALVEMLWTFTARQSGDDFLGEAIIEVTDNPEVRSALDQAGHEIDLLLEATRDEGTLRADASTLDIRLLFAATRAAKHVEPEAWQRMLTLLIDGLRAPAA